MKSYIIGALMIVATLLAAGVVNAMTIGTPTLGGSGQERGVTVTSTFTVSDSTLSVNTTASVTFTLTSNSGYSTVFADNNSSSRVINSWDGSQQTFTVRAFVPLNHDAVDGNLNEAALQIGTISNNRDSSTASIQMQAANHLELDKIEVSIGGKTKTLDDGDEFKDVQIGDDMTIEITAENTFDEDDSDGDMTDVEFRAEVDDSDFDVDEDDEVDIDADEKETISFDNLEINEDVSDGNYDLDITVDGTDENGARHGEAATIELNVERESHEISLRSVTLTKSTVSCTDATTDLSVRIANTGKHDEDDVTIAVQNSALGLNQRVTGLSVDEDESTTRTLSLRPKVDKAGSYTLDVIAYWEGSIESDRDTATLTVSDCSSTSGTTGSTTTGSTGGTTPTGSTVVVTQPTTPTQPTGTQGVPRVSVSSKQTDYTVPLLVVGIIVAGIVLVLLVVMLTRGKPQPA